MGAIVDFFSQKLQAKEAELLIDDTVAKLKQRTGLLYKILPLTTYENDDFLLYVTETLAPAASIVSPGAMVPTTNYGYFRKVVGELAKMALGFSWDETAQKQMRKAMEEAMYKNTHVQNMVMGDGTVMRGTNDLLAKTIYNSITKLIKGHVDRLYMLGAQAIQTGTVHFEDPRTRTVLDINYKRPGAGYDHFPAALVATGNTADRTLNKWTDYEEADGLTLLYNAVCKYEDTNGYLPDGICMSRRLLNHLLQQRTTKEAARSMMVVPQVGSVSPSMLTPILAARGIPPIVVEGMQEQYQEEVFDNQPSNTDEQNIRNVTFFDPNRFFFYKEGMGQLAMGTPEEARYEKNNLGGSSGVLVTVKSDPMTPMKDITQSISVGLPVIAQPRQLYSQKVN